MIVRQINVILQYDRKLEHVKLKKLHTPQTIRNAWGKKPHHI